VKRVVQTFLTGLFLAATVLSATAQQAPQPVVRLGNFLEVGNDVFMHIIASADIRYRTVQNYDFDKQTRDRTPDRSPSSTVSQEGETDLSYAELRLGAEFRYQKNLTLYLLFEHQQVFDGNLIDDRANSTNPGGTDVFGRVPSTENPGFHIERYWIDYKFAGTPLRLRVGADRWAQDQASLVSDDDPRFALFGEFGNFDVMAAAVIQFESQRLGLEDDNDFIYYTFSAGYNLKPHRFQLDVTYFRDRFTGADTQLAGRPSTASGFGYLGQKFNSVLLMASWSGVVGPVRALVQGNILTGTAHSGIDGLPPGTVPDRKYDIFAGAVVAYAEVDLGVVKPFVGLVYGSGDGNPSDTKLHGFMTLPVREGTEIKDNPFLGFLENSAAFYGGVTRDYTCPARAQGVRNTTPPGNPSAVGAAVLGGSPGNGFECAHSGQQLLNDRLGNTSHPGINTSYSNPGVITFPIGVRVYPLTGHEITGWYVHRRVANNALLNQAFIVGVDPGFNGNIRKALYNEFGGFWRWVLNPYFDITLAGNIAIPDGGYRDLGRLADCNPSGPRQGCNADNVALSGEARFRARF
jgi:hypothetical protein